MGAFGDIADAFGLGGRASYENENRVGVREAVPEGAFYSSDLANQRDSMNQRAERQSRTGPQLDQRQLGQYFGAGATAETSQRALAGQQQAHLGALQAAANGTGGPSAAELAMQRASTDAAQQQLMQAAAAGGGPGAVAASVRAQNANAQAQGALQRDLGVQRANEQMAARQLYADALNQTRGQELSAASLYGNLGMTGAQANQAAQLQTMGMDDAMRQFYYGSALQADLANADAQVAYGQTRANYLASLESADASRYGTREGSDQARFGSTVGMAGAALAAVSDVRAKTDIRPAQGRLSEAFREMPPAQGYEYREPDRYGYGPQTGMMAQDLERNPVTRSTVETGPDGMKRVDGGKLAMMTAAEVGQLRRELDDVQRRTVAAIRDPRSAEADQLAQSNARDEALLRALTRASDQQTRAVSTPTAYPTPTPARIGY